MARHVTCATGQDGRRSVRTDITPQQWRVLALTAAGCSTRQIAAALGIKAATVQDHRRLLYLRIGIVAANPGPVAVSAWARGDLTVTGADDDDHNH